MNKKTKVSLGILGILVIAIFTLPHLGYGKLPKIPTEDGLTTKKAPRVLSSTVWVTAYSSSPDETNDNPFITASGERVRKGIVAANFLPLGSTIQIPELFGDEVFVVKDRMHSRKTNFVDIWMPSKKEAKEFGIQKTEILILDSPNTGLTVAH